MRCIIGLTLFMVLYFGGNQLLGEVAGAMAKANEPHLSQKATQTAVYKIVKKYHGLVGVGAWECRSWSVHCPRCSPGVANATNGNMATRTTWPTGFRRLRSFLADHEPARDSAFCHAD